MPVVIEDRPVDSVREEVIDQLILNYAHKKLSKVAFERRLDTAMSSEDNKTIFQLTDDLEPIVDNKYAGSKKNDIGINYTNKPANKVEVLMNIFGGGNRSGRWLVPERIQSFSLFGGSNIDFTDAEFSHQNVTIEVYCLFGGDNIFIPDNINVISKVFCIFGGVDNVTPSIADRHAPTIIIEGIAIFGGIDIKVKRTIKEKFVAFADNLKKLFD